MMAAFLSSEDAERAIRADPEACAREWGAPVEVAQRLARMAPPRVRAFRASMAHKDAVRAGKPPTRIE
jgi:hypothetical protein